MTKKRVIKDYIKLSIDLMTLLEKSYPNGYSSAMKSYFDAHGLRFSAVTLETEDTVYLIRFPEKKVKEPKEEEVLFENNYKGDDVEEKEQIEEDIFQAHDENESDFDE